MFSKCEARRMDIEFIPVTQNKANQALRVHAINAIAMHNPTHIYIHTQSYKIARIAKTEGKVI
jgi:hypothetical protein